MTDLSRVQQMTLYALAASPQGLTFMRLQEFMQQSFDATTVIIGLLVELGYVRAKVENRYREIPRQYYYCTPEGHLYLRTPDE